MSVLLLPTVTSKSKISKSNVKVFLNRDIFCKKFASIVLRLLFILETLETPTKSEDPYIEEVTSLLWC